jgi:hypothetical protein
MMDLELQSTQSHKTWIQGSPQQKEQYSQRSLSQIQIFPFRFSMNSKNLTFGEPGEIRQIEGSRAMDPLQG